MASSNSLILIYLVKNAFIRCLVRNAIIIKNAFTEKSIHEFDPIIQWFKRNVWN